MMPEPKFLQQKYYLTFLKRNNRFLEKKKPKYYHSFIQRNQNDLDNYRNAFLVSDSHSY